MEESNAIHGFLTAQGISTPKPHTRVNRTSCHTHASSARIHQIMVLSTNCRLGKSPALKNSSFNRISAELQQNKRATTAETHYAEFLTGEKQA